MILFSCLPHHLWLIHVIAGRTSPLWVVQKLISKSLNKTVPRCGSGSVLEITCKVWRKIIAWPYSFMERVVLSLHWIILKSLFIKLLHRFDHLHKLYAKVSGVSQSSLWSHKESWTSHHGKGTEEQFWERGSLLSVMFLVPQKWYTMHQELEGKSQIYTESWLLFWKKNPWNLKLQENTRCRYIHYLVIQCQADQETLPRHINCNNSPWCYDKYYNLCTGCTLTCQYNPLGRWLETF